MHRRKINQEEIKPQEDRVMLLASKRKINVPKSYSLVPQPHRNKRKGNPIDIPCQPSGPKHTGVSIDKTDDASLFYATPTEFQPRLPYSRSTRLGNLKKADESKRRSTTKPQGSGKSTMILSSDDEDKHHIYVKFGNGMTDNHKRQMIKTYPLSNRKPSSSSSSSLPNNSLSKKEKALGRGRLPRPHPSSQTHDDSLFRISPKSSSSSSSQTDSLVRMPSPKAITAAGRKTPYHSFSQNHHQRDDTTTTNHTLPYWKKHQEQHQQINQHRRFESSDDDDEASNVNTQSTKEKKTATTTSATDITMVDVSDNEDIYHSACSVSSDTKHANDNNEQSNSMNDDKGQSNGMNDDNEQSNNNNNNNKRRERYLEEKLIKPPSSSINRGHSRTRSSSNQLTKQDQQQRQSQTPPPLSSSSPSSPSTSIPKEPSLHHIKNDNDSPAPVELSDDEMDDVNDKILFTYPINRSKGSITVTVEDRKRLEVDQFLNDSIIDFYLKLLMDSYSVENGYRQYSSKTRTAVENTHIFSSFFYNRLTQGSGVGWSRNKPISYENVRKWTSTIDLFSKKYAIFPINEKWHWYLVLVCNLDKCIPDQTTMVDPLLPTDARDQPHIFILDSLGGTQRNTMTNINDYLLTEAQHRRHVDPSVFVQPELHYANVPKQDNSCDCGVFLLHFVDQFLNSPRNFIRILLERDAQHVKWKEGEIKEKRSELKTLFKKIHREYKVEHESEK